jgi:hypothetical protein
VDSAAENDAFLLFADISITSSIAAQPASLFSCLDEELNIDLERFLRYSHARFAENKRRRTEDEENYQRKNKRGRNPRAHYERLYDPDDCEHSSWWNYVSSDKCKGKKSRLAKQFRRHFRMWWESYRALMEEIKRDNWFVEYVYEKPNALSQPGVPLDLLVLGSLRYLGRGWTSDDI